MELKNIISMARIVLVETDNVELSRGKTYKIMKHNEIMGAKENELISNNVPPLETLKIKDVIDDYGILILNKK